MNLSRNLQLLYRLITSVKNWPVYFLNRFGYMEGRKEVRFKLWNGMTVVGRPFSIDRAVINEEILDRCYEPNDVGIPFDWSSCKTIIDIGSHIGVFSMYAAAKAKHARIWAFEPEHSNAETLRRNIEANHLEGRMQAIESAVGATDGTVTFHVSFEKSASGGHSVYDYTNHGKAVTVPAISFSAWLERENIGPIDFLKVDCEGAEYEIFYGLTHDQMKRIRFIAMEYHHFSKDPRHTPVALRSFLEMHGFMVTEPHKSIFFAWRK